MAVSKFFRFIDESGRTSYGEVPQGLEAKDWVRLLSITLL